MKRGALFLAALAAVSCDTKPAMTPAERGAALFRPAAERIGDAQATEMQAKVPKAYDTYVKESGSHEALARRLGGELLTHYAAALAVSEAEEKEFKAGRFKDVEGRQKLNALLGQFESGKAAVTPTGKIVILKTQAGADWNSGLQLEFALRVLSSEMGSPK